MLQFPASHVSLLPPASSSPSSFPCSATHSLGAGGQGVSDKQGRHCGVVREPAPEAARRRVVAAGLARKRRGEGGGGAGRGAGPALFSLRVCWQTWQRLRCIWAGPIWLGLRYGGTSALAAKHYLPGLACRLGKHSHQPWGQRKQRREIPGAQNPVLVFFWQTPMYSTR